MLPSLSSNKSVPEPVKQSEFISKIDNTELFQLIYWHLCSIVYLSNVQQAN